MTGKPVEDVTDAEVDAELAAVYAQAEPGHIASAFVAAVKIGEMEAAVGLLGMLARKDPEYADVLVRTLKLNLRDERRARGAS